MSLQTAVLTDFSAGELKAMIAALSPAKSEIETLPSEEVMRMFGYSRQDKFWIAVKNARVPFIRVSSRRSIFNRADVEAWMKRRTRNTQS